MRSIGNFRTYWGNVDSSSVCVMIATVMIAARFVSSSRLLYHLVRSSRSAIWSSTNIQLISGLDKDEELWFAFERNRFPSDTWSLESMDWAKNCISRCEQSHGCHDPAHPPRLPTRVLDVKVSGPTICLHESVDEKSHYICLSHCWGPGGLDTKTTQMTIEKFKRGILITDLPLTFQHAIEITRNLGIRYLWIDALCIIQDEEDYADWMKEAPQMARIYSDAYLTIAATASHDSQGGCYRSVSEATRGQIIEFVSKGGTSIPVIVDKNRPHFEVYYPNTDTDNDFPLLKRAWAFQERVLSPRVLHFCNFELVFECEQHTICQCREHPLPDKRFKALNQIRPGYATMEEQRHGLQWSDIIQVSV